ncbi:DUF1996 domain-containing protein [Phytohabitans kaempferiae]|uniref:DUF1996 domain-containing protein n=1 Tax=Phytohabitans kaempferiae TaxID=1620943 RepID=A0ABV6MCS5_9ACTN
MLTRVLPPSGPRRRQRLRYSIVAAIVALTAAVTSWTAIGPLRLAGAEETPLSQGKPASASSVEGASWSAARAVDGDDRTRWSSAFQDAQWLRVDLGAQARVDRVVLRWERAYATAFEIQVSPEGATWNSVYRTTAGTGGEQELDVSGEGRFVRVHGTKRATGYGFSLWEFQVYGTRLEPAPTAGPTSTPGTSPSTEPSTLPKPSPSMSHPGHGSGEGGGYVMADQPVTGVVPSTARPPRKEHREFQANCAPSHRLPDDPIVFPNRAGASHDHTFMGNTTTNAASTTASLLDGNTMCVVPGDKSGYWMPTVYNGDTPVLPDGPQVIYYKSGVRDYTSVRPFPVGLRFLVGSPTTTAAQFESSPAYQKGWECGDSYENVDFPASCPAGTQLNIRMQAPSCWDGLHLDTPDHKSHIVYPVDEVCPVDHPVAVPMIEFKMAFPVSGDMSKVRLSSGRGYSFHYDFYNAWDIPTLTALVKHCVNAGRQCDARGYDQFDPSAGAALDEHYQVAGSREILDRTGWTATASRTGDSPAKMLDGDRNSRWTTGAPMTDGQSVTVDMRGVHPVSGLSLLSTGSDYARGYEVFLSTDGNTWTGPVADGKGFATQILATFAQRDARYIKVVQTGSASSWWSVAELTVYSG